MIVAILAALVCFMLLWAAFKVATIAAVVASILLGVVVYLLFHVRGTTRGNRRAP